MKKIFLPILLAIFLISCHQQQEETKSEPEKRAQIHLLGGTLFTQVSAEYRALCYQAFELGKMRLQEELRNNPKNPAVVLDLDETVLDNSPYTAWQVVNDQPFDPKTWDDWVKLAEAPAVPGALDFLNFADSLNVTLFYVSNRDSAQLSPTMRNMAALGIPQIDQAHFLLKTNTGDKEKRRQRIIADGYDILFFVGDNLGDYRSDYDKPATNVQRNQFADSCRSDFGKNFIVLPNTTYGTWEGALYDYDRSLSTSALDSLRFKALQPAKLDAPSRSDN